MHSLNNLVVVGNDKFFFTNYYYLTKGLEIMFALPTGNFGFFDGVHSTVLETRLPCPNGISVSPDGKLVFMTVLIENALFVYYSLVYFSSLRIRKRESLTA